MDTRTLRGRLVRPSAGDLALVRAVDPVRLAEAGPFDLRTVTRIVAGLPVQRTSLTLAVERARALAPRGSNPPEAA